MILHVVSSPQCRSSFFVRGVDCLSSDVRSLSDVVVSTPSSLITGGQGLRGYHNYMWTYERNRSITRHRWKRESPNRYTKRTDDPTITYTILVPERYMDVPTSMREENGRMVLFLCGVLSTIKFLLLSVDLVYHDLGNDLVGLDSTGYLSTRSLFSNK